MALVNSVMVPLGTEAPDFSLPDAVTQRTVSLADFDAKKALLVMFICNHCPFVTHVADQLALLGVDYADKELGMVAICCNDLANYPLDSPRCMKDEALARNYRFPYLFDATQEAAKAYKAACTPDFFLYGADRKLAYRGRLDGARPGNNEPNDGADLRRAIDLVLAGEPVPEPHRPSAGCNIKWIKGNEPEYFFQR